MKQIDMYIEKIEDIVNTFYYDYYEKIMQYLDLLKEFGGSINLYSRRNEKNLYKNFIDVLVAISKLDLGNNIKKIYDIGSGNGLPGVLLAIVFENIDVVIIERKLKKIDFLKLVKLKLNINNLYFVEQDFEPELLENNFLIFMKGMNPKDIMEEIKKSNLKGKIYYFSTTDNEEYKTLFNYKLPVFGLNYSIKEIEFT